MFCSNEIVAGFSDDGEGGEVLGTDLVVTGKALQKVPAEDQGGAVSAAQPGGQGAGTSAVGAATGAPPKVLDLNAPASSSGSQSAPGDMAGAIDIPLDL